MTTFCSSAAVGVNSASDNQDFVRRNRTDDRTLCVHGDPPSPRTVSVLLIEDDELDVQLLRRILNLCREPTFDVTLVETLAAATEELATGRYDVVLMDLGLPDSAGLDSVEKLRVFDAIVPIVVLTGLEDEVVAMKSIEAGAQDYLSKMNLSGLTLIRSLRFSIARQLKYTGLEASAGLDPLTGLPNRRELERQYTHTLSTADRAGHSMAMAILDLDHFKEVNDRHGHFVGDVVLQTFATRTVAAMAPDWHVARFGGEEFMVLFATADIHRQRNRIDAFLDQLTREPFRVSHSSIAVTASCGLIVVDPLESFTDAYIRADRWLYRAKQAGRRCLKTSLDHHDPMA